MYPTRILTNARRHTYKVANYNTIIAKDGGACALVGSINTLKNCATVRTNMRYSDVLTWGKVRDAKQNVTRKEGTRICMQ